MKKIISALVVCFISQFANAQDLLLVCPSPLHQDIDSLVIMANKNASSEAALMQLKMVNGTTVTRPTTKEDVVEGYIQLPEFESKERVLLLDEDKWFVAVFGKSSVLMTPTQCWEPSK